MSPFKISWQQTILFISNSIQIMLKKKRSSHSWCKIAILVLKEKKKKEKEKLFLRLVRIKYFRKKKNGSIVPLKSCHRGNP